MKIRIFLIFLSLFLLKNAVFAGGNPFELPELKLSNKTDQRLWIGDNWVKDSTNYFVFNQGVLVWDSLRVRRDLYVGSTGGKIYLDTLAKFQIYATGYDLYIVNNKDYGSHYYYIGDSSSAYYWYKNSGSVSSQLMQLDTMSGLTVTYGDIQLTGGTQQIKFPSDTASDYHTDDTVRLNKQSGIITSKTITNAAVTDYYLYLHNSLISATSKVFANINDNTSAGGVPVIRQVKTFAGYCLIVIYNASATVAVNGVLTINFLVIN